MQSQESVALGAESDALAESTCDAVSPSESCPTEVRLVARFMRLVVRRGEATRGQGEGDCGRGGAMARNPGNRRLVGDVTSMS